MSVGVVVAGQGAGQSERGWWRVASKNSRDAPVASRSLSASRAEQSRQLLKGQRWGAVLRTRRSWVRIAPDACEVTRDESPAPRNPFMGDRSRCRRTLINE